MNRDAIIEAISKYEYVVFKKVSQTISYAEIEDELYYLVDGTDHREKLLESELGACRIATSNEVDEYLQEMKDERNLGLLRSFLA